MIRQVLLMIAITAAAFSPMTAADNPGKGCDRACLQGYIDSYFDALAKHDPSKLPTAPNVRFTENGKEMKLGDGFWKTAGQSKYRLYALDPSAGDAAAQAVVEENGDLDTFFVRLKLKNKKITEVETLVARKGQAGFFAPEKMTTAPAIYSETVPDKDQSARSQLIRDASAYFTAVQTEGTPDFKEAPLAPKMNRYENGVQTTNVPVMGQPAMSGSEQLSKGMFKGLVIDHRRFPVVDVEHGVVVGLVLMHANRNKQKQDILISEMFKIVAAKIQEVQAVMVNVPPNSTTGWK